MSSTWPIRPGTRLVPLPGWTSEAPSVGYYSRAADFLPTASGRGPAADASRSFWREYIIAWLSRETHDSGAGTADGSRDGKVRPFCGENCRTVGVIAYDGTIVNSIGMEEPPCRPRALAGFDKGTITPGIPRDHVQARADDLLAYTFVTVYLSRIRDSRHHPVKCRWR